MALDGGFIYALALELQECVGSHIDKIHQPTKNELVLILRGKNGTKRLLISRVSGSARVHLTESRPENPETAPMFCMLLRKHFCGGKIKSIETENFERVIKITVASHSALGDEVFPCLYIELISSAPNIVAVDGAGRILDAAMRSDMEREGRLLQPGAIYEAPQNNKKLNLLLSGEQEIEKMLMLSPENLLKAMLGGIAGLSPIVCRELCFRAGIEENIKPQELSLGQKKSLMAAIAELKGCLREPSAYICTLLGGRKELSVIPLTAVACEVKKCEGFSAALEEFYTAEANSQRVAAAARDIQKAVSTLLSRAQKRLESRRLSLKKTEGSEQKRIFGELIKANLYGIFAGQTSVVVQNYYDENLSEIKIPLDPALSPAANAAKYFKEYKKSQTAARLLAEFIKEDLSEIEYLQSVRFSIGEAQSLEDIEAIREELKEAGYIKSSSKAKKKKEDTAFIKHISPSGYTVLIGKNNRQNDLLTLKTAAKNDMWFHTKDIAGSHTVLLCAGAQPEKEDILFAARLCALHSRAKDSSGVPVDYTRIKFVKKPSGAKAGMVVYTDNSTVYVTPREQEDKQ